MRLDGKKILVADDEIRLSQLLAMFLGEQGAIVETVHNGQDAFRAATMHRPDAIIMDLNMPGVNGLEAIRSLRMTLSDTPILVLTGYCTKEHFAQALEAGATKCVAKPPSLATLTDTISQLLEDAEEKNNSGESDD
ncbi:MAG: response regulator [Planctomycetes bacterium]|nr:response regulator [Planctomycetota bacterium]